MKPIRVSNGMPGIGARLFGAVPQVGADYRLQTHQLANRAEVDRVYFQLPDIEPYSPVYQKYPIPTLVQSVPGVFTVNRVKAAELLNERGNVANIDDPRRYRVPTYVAHLAVRRGRLHPATLGTFIREMVEDAYAPDKIISVFYRSLAVRQWEEPKQSLTIRRNR